MTKFSRPRSWVEHRLADELAIEGASYVVDLVARRGTGSAGFRVTAVFMPLAAGGREVEVELPPAASTTEVHQQVRELSGNGERLAALFRGSRSGDAPA
jgi:hypothetical protein